MKIKQIRDDLKKYRAIFIYVDENTIEIVMFTNHYK